MPVVIGSMRVVPVKVLVRYVMGQKTQLIIDNSLSNKMFEDMTQKGFQLSYV